MNYIISWVLAVSVGTTTGMIVLFALLIAEIRRDRTERARIRGELRAAYRALRDVRFLTPTPIPIVHERETEPIPLAPSTRRVPMHDAADGPPTEIY